MYWLEDLYTHLTVPCRLLLPLVTWLVVGGIERISNDTNSTSDAMFGFLYGTFPTAPSVFLYASHYSTATDLVSPGFISRFSHYIWLEPLVIFGHVTLSCNYESHCLKNLLVICYMFLKTFYVVLFYTCLVKGYFERNLINNSLQDILLKHNLWKFWMIIWLCLFFHTSTLQ